MQDRLQVFFAREIEHTCIGISYIRVPIMTFFCFYLGSKRQLSKVSAQLGGIVRSCKRLKKYVGMQLSASQNTSQSQM